MKQGERGQSKRSQNIRTLGIFTCAALLLIYLFVLPSATNEKSDDTVTTIQGGDEIADRMQIKNPFAGVGTAKTGSWPMLVGKDVDAAVAQIKSERPKLKVHKLPKDSMVTKDWRMDRVRVFYDTATNKVTRAPMVG